MNAGQQQKDKDLEWKMLPNGINLLELIHGFPLWMKNDIRKKSDRSTENIFLEQIDNLKSKMCG